VPQRVKFNYEPSRAGPSRPYLWLKLHTESGPTLRARGLLDTGADITILDNGYLPALGLAPDALEPVGIDSPAGKLRGQRSRQVIWASLPGAPANQAPLRPIFIDADGEARWGRDFMQIYAVAFDEETQQFSLYGRHMDPTNPSDP
jgi:hypothetical protein